MPSIIRKNISLRKYKFRNTRKNFWMHSIHQEQLQFKKEKVIYAFEMLCWGDVEKKCFAQEESLTCETELIFGEKTGWIVVA